MKTHNAYDRLIEGAKSNVSSFALLSSSAFRAGMSSNGAFSSRRWPSWTTTRLTRGEWLGDVPTGDEIPMFCRYEIAEDGEGWHLDVMPDVDAAERDADALVGCPPVVNVGHYVYQFPSMEHGPRLWGWDGEWSRYALVWEALD